MFPAMPDLAPAPPASAAVDTPIGSASVDPQDALPESNWIPRRWYVFTMTGASLLLVLYGLANKADGGVLIALIVFASLLALFYMVAPSAEQFGKIAQAVSAMKAGVTFKTSSSADVGAGTATSSTSAGQPAKGSVASE